MKAEKNPARRRRPLAGFTLLELITVMGIIVAMSAMVVGGYASITRAIADMAGMNTLRKAITACRQHASVDGRDTYLFITQNDRFVICRRAGVITEITPLSTPSGSPVGDVPPYINGSANAYWVRDAFSDLGAASENFAIMDSKGAASTDGKLSFADAYSGMKVFNLSRGKFATITYPPWFNVDRDAWIFGINKVDSEDEVGTGAFKADDIYGWIIYPEQRLPKGYYFVKGNNDFELNGYIRFKPDGTAEGKNDLSGKAISVKEIATGNISTITIQENGSLKESKTTGN